MERWLILARKRAQSGTADSRVRAEGAGGEATEAPSLSREEWETRYRDALESIDRSFDNGAGAFFAIATVPDRMVLQQLLREYPWRMWIDIETRPLPLTSQAERQRWRALAEEAEEARRAARAQPLGVYYEQGVRRWERLLATAEAIDPHHPFVADLLAVLRHDYQDSNRYPEMETIARRLLALHEHLVGSDDPVLIVDLIVLASACDNQGWTQRDRRKAKEAETYYRRALAIAEQVLESSDERVHSCLHQLGQFYMNRRRYAQAEPLLRRLVALDEDAVQQALEKSSGNKSDADRRSGRPRILELASDMSLLAELYVAQRRFDEAEMLFRRMLEWHGHHSDGDQDGDNAAMHKSLLHRKLASVFSAQGRYQEAAQCYAQAVHEFDTFVSWGLVHHTGARYAMTRASLGSMRTQMRAELLRDWATVLRRLGHVDDAERLYQDALTLLESATAESPVTESPGEPSILRQSRVLIRDTTLASVLRAYATLLRVSGRRKEARDLRQRAHALTESVEERRRLLFPQDAQTQEDGASLTAATDTGS